MRKRSTTSTVELLAVLGALVRLVCGDYWNGASEVSFDESGDKRPCSPRCSSVGFGGLDCFPGLSRRQCHEHGPLHSVHKIVVYGLNRTMRAVSVLLAGGNRPLGQCSNVNSIVHAHG
jgi:hypothetical protein